LAGLFFANQADFQIDIDNFGQMKYSQQFTAISRLLHSKIATAIGTMPRKNMTFLLTEAGAPFTAAGLGKWFRDRCNEAGLQHCPAHGLRKACATRLANAGCTVEQIKPITEHKTLSEVGRYTKAADQGRNAKQALVNLLSSESEQAHPTFDLRLDKSGEK